MGVSPRGQRTQGRLFRLCRYTPSGLTDGSCARKYSDQTVCDGRREPERTGGVTTEVWKTGQSGGTPVHRIPREDSPLNVK